MPCWKPKSLDAQLPAVAALQRSRPRGIVMSATESPRPLHMARAWNPGSIPRPHTALAADLMVRPLAAADVEELGQVMWSAFHGTPDDEYDTPADAEAEAAETLAGKWGPVVWAASFGCEASARLIGAGIVVLDRAHEQLPLLAFLLTVPERQRAGIGRRLVEESLYGLGSSGWFELHLAVLPMNPAIRLYRRLGFETVV
jgi:GNAT superfamily N-acetyltransferase